MQVYQQLLRQNTSIREQQSHQPPQPTNDFVQLAAPLPRTTSTTTPSPPTSPSRRSASTSSPPGLQPPPGIQLPQHLPGDHLRPPVLTSAPASSSCRVGPPRLVAPPQTHRPAGRRLNRPRAVNMVDDSVSTGILHLDVNESKDEAQLSASALLDNITLQSWLSGRSFNICGGGHQAGHAQRIPTATTTTTTCRHANQQEQPH